jgi:hypothetical protein
MPRQRSKRSGDSIRAGASPSQVRACWHVQSGTSLPELMELGGWKSSEMVLRYAHLLGVSS